MNCFLKLHGVQAQAGLLHRFHKRWPADHRHRRSGPRQQSAEVTTDCARADNSYFRPIVFIRHFGFVLQFGFIETAESYIKSGFVIRGRLAG